MAEPISGTACPERVAKVDESLPFGARGEPVGPAREADRLSRLVPGYVETISRKVESWLTAARMLVRAGARPGSILLYPLRRRLPNPRIRIDLRSGISILSPPGEPLPEMLEEIWVNRCYAPEGLKVAAGHTIVDVGAHVGLFTLWAATSNPGIRIISLEPSPQVCEFLRKNVSINRLDNVAVLQSACGGRRGERVLYSRGPGAANTFYTRDNYNSSFFPIAATSVITLDDLFEDFDVRTCGFLKLDCEGAEYEILMNAAKETLNKVQRISAEYHVGLNEYTPEQLVDFLRAYGFEVHRMPMPNAEVGYLYARRM